MNLALTSKGSYSGVDAARVYADIEAHVTRSEYEHAMTAAVVETLSMVGELAGGQADRCVYGWSGGKDSIALQELMDRCDIRRSVIGLIPHLEFEGYLEWVADHRPPEIVVVANKKLDLTWLARPANQRFLYPATGNDGYFWTLQGTRYAQTRYQEILRPRLHLYGRRTQDGNQCGVDGVTKTRDRQVFCPLRAWPHELVLAAIHYSGRTLPPVPYGHASGWTSGTGSWPGRRVSTDKAACWDDTYAIESARVYDAADAGVPGAQDCIDRRGVH